jgi:hypothetical protein
LRLLAEGARRLAEALLEGSAERFRPFVARVERDPDDRLGPESQLVRRPLQPDQLHIAIDADPEQGGELPMEMELAAARDAAQHVDAQVFCRMLVGMPQHALEAGLIGRLHFVLRLGGPRITGCRSVPPDGNC